MRLCDKMKHTENRIMKKKITLPFEEQLVMRRYRSMAFPTGIIQGGRQGRDYTMAIGHPFSWNEKRFAKGGGHHVPCKTVNNHD